ncbi:sensor histidine kinase [Sulfurospirillum sp. T05]|uniref:histidine kinase n=1 Tax=Sulfurospirillum tamanense TaxID=2813362 RepID=A0ABS2WTJ3_9BACT|nr:sensor histidine kinase [Sulfurospirillum tamanensis]MBN2964979.1 sensor histidine kinase [Sulfurospirillum tamanensis]
MRLWVIAALFFLTWCTCASLWASDTKQILVINSYHKGFQWSDDMLSGIEEVLYEHPDITTNILYMDSKRISSEEYFATLRELYKLQLKNQRYDLIVAIDTFAYNFLLKYYHEIFTDEPLLFTGPEQFSLEAVQKVGLEDRVVGLLEKRAIEESIPLISKMMPSLKKLTIINDGSTNGDDSDLFIRQAILDNQDTFEVEYIRHSSLEALEARFSTPRPNEAIFFIRFYNAHDGTFYKNNQIAAMIDKSALPVFVTDTLFMGKGALGGKVVPIRALGENTGKLILQTLKGEITPLHVSTDETYEYQFDVQKLAHFGLSPHPHVGSYTRLNAPLGFFDKHRVFVDTIFVASPLLVLLILGLGHNIYMRARNEAKQRAIELQQNKHQQFIVQQAKLAEIGEVFSSIAHQWKSPLIEIAAIAQEHVYTCKDQPQEENNQYVNDIMVQVRYMTDTINDFQKFIMPSVDKSVFDVAETIEEMLKIINHTIKYSYIDITVRKQGTQRLLVNGYKNEFMQTLLNIVNNAKDQITLARERGAIKRGEISITLSCDADKIILAICDNGGGIPEGKLPQVFDAYFTTKEEGHGIGLYMTRLIIEEKMGGKIWASNTPVGACFTILLGSAA